jgi:ketosteroid isomerase-like protein
MSEENVAAVRAAYERWAEGDFLGGVDLFDPEIEFILTADFPDSGTYRGPEAVAGYMRHLLEPWERLTIVAEELTDAGDRVIAAVFQSGVGIGSGVPTSVRYFQVWTFSGDRVIRLQNLREAPAR